MKQKNLTPPPLLFCLSSQISQPNKNPSPPLQPNNLQKVVWCLTNYNRSKLNLFPLNFLSWNRTTFGISMPYSKLCSNALSSGVPTKSYIYSNILTLHQEKNKSKKILTTKHGDRYRSCSVPPLMDKDRWHGSCFIVLDRIHKNIRLPVRHGW